MKNAFVLFCLLLSFSIVSAQTRNSSEHPSSFCKLGEAIGYPTGAFTTDDIPGCSSPFKELTPTPGKNRQRNRLAFYSLAEFGNTARLYRVSLSLYVNNPSEARAAYQELERATKILSEKILGQTPKGLSRAIDTRKAWQQKVDSWVVEVKINEFRPSSDGHQLMVIFRPS